MRGFPIAFSRDCTEEDFECAQLQRRGLEPFQSHFFEIVFHKVAKH